MKTSQVWSMDIMIAIVIFMGAIFVFYSILNNKYSGKTDELKNDASIVLENLAAKDSDMSVIDGVQINATRLEELLGKDYLDIKKKARVKNEFCIFFEDDNGNIIYISQNQAGIGSEKIKISDVPCG